jgi:hypothetical protein
MTVIRDLVVYYLLIAFIEWDLLVINWWIFTTKFGRLTLVLYLLYIAHIKAKQNEKNRVINQEQHNDKAS